MAKVRVVFKKHGGLVESEVNGVKGEACTEVTKFLDELGETTIETTSEYSQKAEETEVLINEEN